MVQQLQIELPPYPYGIHLITSAIVENLPALPRSGLLSLFIRHTSAAITIGENADSSVRNDFKSFFDRLVPELQPWFTHTNEGPDDMPAHLKAALVGFSVAIPVFNGKLNMGTWQGIYLCEFRKNAPARCLTATILT